MKIKVNTIITLSNKQYYVVLSETFYDGVKYYLMMGLDEKKELISSKVAIFAEKIENNKTYVKQIKDTKLLLVLTKLLKSQA